VRGFRVQESDSPSAGPAPGRLIDQFVARRATARERGLQVRDAVADVMDARPAFCKEFRHGTVGVVRLEELDVDAAEMKADDRGAIDDLARSGRESQDVSIEGQRLGDARDGDADVSN